MKELGVPLEVRRLHFKRVEKAYHSGRESRAMAAEWYKRAAERGSAEAQCRLGKCFRNGSGVEKSKATALELHLKAAEQGNAEGQYRAGKCFVHGDGASKDEAKGVEKGFRAGTRESTVSYRFSFGTGVVKDEAKSFEWYLKSAEQGYASAQYAAGICFSFGRGTSKNELKAAEMLTKAADQGDELTQVWLVLLFASGSNLFAGNEGRGFEWCKMHAIKSG